MTTPYLADVGRVTQLQAERFRLVTRSDFDGLVCAALLKQGTCQAANEDAERALGELVGRINADG
jgi:hypothetical protein